MLLIIIPFAIDLIQNVGLSILQALNQYDFRDKVYLGMGILNLLLTIPLGMKYGGIGCAFATGLCMFIGNGLVMNWYYAKAVGLAISEFWKQIGKITVAGVVCLFFGQWMNTQLADGSMMRFVSSIGIYVGVYLFVMWYGALNGNEKALIRKALHR